MKSIKALGTRGLLLITSGVIIVLLVAVGILFIKYNDLKKDPASNANASARIVQEVSKIYAVPANEQPSVALVQDKAKLRQQPFFGSVENGDYILIYTNSKLAIVYREKDNKLMKVGPINISKDNTTDGTATTGTDKN
jgi:hypothetical protein